MRIEHVAIWVSNLELVKEFYVQYFDAKANQLYHNANTGFSSYFLRLGGDSRIELMHRPDVFQKPSGVGFGYAHLAISVGSREKVIELTEKLNEDGYRLVGYPRVTGDGYFESVIADPDGNLIEITV